MGEAIVACLLASDFCHAEKIAVAEPIDSRRDQLAARYGVRAVASNLEAAAEADVVVVAVRPQQLHDVISDLDGRLGPQQLVLSIVAGATLGTLSDALHHPAVVRVMPNTAAAVGEAMSVWIRAPAVTAAQAELARTLLAALGRELEVAEERYLDAATAINGSGPGFVFLLLEAFEDAAVHLGFARPAARELALQTMLGACRLARETGQHPAELRNMVTSPGGTTAAGLLVLEEAGVRAAVVKAAIAAYERCLELGTASPK